MSRLLATVVTSPLELIRTRQASRIATAPLIESTTSSSLISLNQSQPLMKELQTLIQTEGFSSLYKGLGPTLYRDVPFSAIYWLCLERFKSILNQRYADSVIDSKISPLMASTNAFISGALSGMIAAFCTTPFDVVKTRQQMELLQQVASEEKQKMDLVKPPKNPCVHHNNFRRTNGIVQSNSTLAQLREIAATEGIQGLWRGNQTRMIKVAPACAIMISCYEFGKRILEVE